MVPLLATQLLHLRGGTWASLGGFSAAVADRGGAYRIRAQTMGALTVGAALAVVIAGLVGANDVLAVALTFVVVGVLSLGREFGISAGGVGTSIAVDDERERDGQDVVRADQSGRSEEHTSE